jgi:uncharacterized protein YjbI with pentapeptide repeats
MSGCDLRQSNLSAADFSGAILENALFEDANTMTTDFRGCVLEGARGFSSRQLGQSLTSFGTILPSGIRGPFVNVR